ncbi:MAG: PIN domain-containing protein [Opitutales bacterium]|nr:PIN domain-containing protein [Opitutales bacterium]
MPNAFVDTNILVYAAEETDPLPPKSRTARDLLLQRGLFLSVQVLNEFVANARHPDKLDLSPAEEQDWIRQWMLFRILPLTTETFVRALEIHLRYGLSHWDSLIVGSANAADCELLYSEDLSHGQTYGGTRVVNPFVHD